MKVENFNWQGGQVQYWNLSYLNESKAPNEQLDHLIEDLAQVTYSNGKVIDVGWYPEMSKLGKFRILVVKDSEWDEPIFDKSIANFSDLSKFIKEAILTTRS